jgi:hypothetical protein
LFYDVNKNDQGMGKNVHIWARISIDGYFAPKQKTKPAKKSGRLRRI